MSRKPLRSSSWPHIADPDYPASNEFKGSLGSASRPQVIEFVEMLKASIKLLHPLRRCPVPQRPGGS